MQSKNPIIGKTIGNRNVFSTGSRLLTFNTTSAKLTIANTNRMMKLAILARFINENKMVSKNNRIINIIVDLSGVLYLE